MRYTAVYNSFFAFAVAVLLVAAPQFLLAGGSPDPPCTERGKKMKAGPGSLVIACEKTKKEAVEVGDHFPETVEPAQQPARRQPEKAAAPNTNISFNFLYYLFYKFSASEFFKTPDYTEATGY